MVEAKAVIFDAEEVEDAEERLIEELKALCEALHESSRSELAGLSQDVPEPDWTVVATLRPGLTMERWQEIATRLQLDSWVALPGKKAEFPLLGRLLQRLDQLAHESQHDPLTGLMNRRGFEQLLAVEMERSRRFGTLLSLAILDVDDFKQVNDLYGHPCGDQTLIALAQLLRTRTRKINFQARLGGDELALLLPGNSHLQVQVMLRRLQHQFRSKRFNCSGSTYSLTFSAGVACFQGEPQVSAAQLVRQADQALYEAKRQGKDKTVCAPFHEREGRPSMVSQEEKKALFKSRRKKP